MRKVLIITACIIAVAALPGSAPATDQGKAAHPQVVNPPPRTVPASVDRPAPPVAPVAAIPAKPATALPKTAPAPQSKAHPPAPKPAAKMMARQPTNSSLEQAKPKQVLTSPGQTSGPQRQMNLKSGPQKVQAIQPKPEITLVRKPEQAAARKPAVAPSPKTASSKKLTPAVNSSHNQISKRHVTQLKATVAPDKFKFRHPGFNRLINQQKNSIPPKAPSKTVSFSKSPQRAQVQAPAPSPVQRQQSFRPKTVAQPRMQTKPIPSRLKASAGLQVPIRIRPNLGPRANAVAPAAKTVPSAQKPQTNQSKRSPISKPSIKAAPARTTSTLKQSPVPKHVPREAKPKTGKCECKPCPRVNASPRNLSKRAQQLTAPAPAVVAPKQIPIPNKALPAAINAAQPKQVAKSAHVVAQPKARIQRRSASTKQTEPVSAPASVPTVEANNAPPAEASKWTETPASAGQRPPIQNQTQPPSVQR